MQRVPEPEVMDDAAQALAYACADFSDVNQRFVDGLLARFPSARRGVAVDLGCGPADIPRRLATAAPRTHVVAIDASLPMLQLGRRALGRRAARVGLVCARLPALPLPAGVADTIVSNSLLHHLPEPAALWREIARLARPGAVVHVMDLFRPDSAGAARAIVEAAAAKEDPILKQDFFNSLLAAYTVAEVRSQLDAAGLRLGCEPVSERHLLVYGRL
jgi:SAM-dependent methyltransferase